MWWECQISPLVKAHLPTFWKDRQQKWTSFDAINTVTQSTVFYIGQVYTCTHTHTRVYYEFTSIFPVLVWLYSRERWLHCLFQLFLFYFHRCIQLFFNSTWSSLQHVLVFRIEQVLHVLAFPSVDSRLLFLGTSKSQTQQPLQALVQRSTRPCGSGWPDGKPEAYYTAPSKLCVHDGLAGLHQFRSGEFLQPLHTTIQQHVLFTI